MAKAVICLTSAPPGSGKSYCRFARFVWDDWLPNCAPGVHWSNFPVRFEPWKDERGNEGSGLVALASKRFKIAPEVVRERVRTIPEEVTRSWQDEEKIDGPWNYFKDLDINGAHIAIDEAHSYFPQRGRPKHAKALMEWLAEIRHRGATVEFITQHPGQVCAELRRAAGEQIILTNLENEVEPFFGIRVGDWLEMLAGWFTGRYVSYVRQERLIQWGSGWKVAQSRAFSLDPWYFGLYDSYSAPVAGGSAGMGQQSPWQKFGRLRLLWWFYSRNAFQLSWRGVVAALMIWVLFLGGQKVLVEKFQQGVSSVIAAGTMGGGVATKSAGEVKGGQGGDVVTPAGSVGVKGEQIELEVFDWDGGKVKKRTLKGPREKVSLEAMAACERVSAQVGRVMSREKELAERVRECEDRLGELGGAVMVYGDRVRFESGDEFAVGEVIDYGPYQGLRVAAIDAKRRAVRLSDNRLVRLGFDSRRMQDGGGQAGGSGVPANLSGNAAGRGSPFGQGGRNDAQLFGEGYPGSGFGAVAGRQNGSVDSSPRGPGFTPRVDGDSEAVPNGSTRRFGGAFGGYSGSSGAALLPRTEPSGFTGGAGSESTEIRFSGDTTSGRNALK